ncbi:thioesterase domain-containing protein [Ghiorsea bivora]|uniref:thioesterase domain-containing protein n=1 Tax=Ghiorsea bivora TaxID=1485545 RepID=UPI00057136C2|nr:thioesterase domain-containing protein [Ghiorsea bivora]
MIKQLQDVLHTEIPLTKHIGLSVVKHTELSLTLSAPLEKNINHKCTAFGGSIYSVSVLSGWGLIYLLLKQHNLSGHIVIQESNTKFSKPVNSDITATCSFISIRQCDKFINMYKRKGVARIKLVSKISCNSENAVTFNGTYVVHT